MESLHFLKCKLKCGTTLINGVWIILLKCFLLIMSRQKIYLNMMSGQKSTPAQIRMEALKSFYMVKLIHLVVRMISLMAKLIHLVVKMISLMAKLIHLVVRMILHMAKLIHLVVQILLKILQLILMK